MDFGRRLGASNERMRIYEIDHLDGAISLQVVQAAPVGLDRSVNFRSCQHSSNFKHYQTYGFDQDQTRARLAHHCRRGYNDHP
jgi:hypothetical protein